MDGSLPRHLQIGLAEQHGRKGGGNSWDCGKGGDKGGRGGPYNATQMYEMADCWWCQRGQCYHHSDNSKRSPVVQDSGEGKAKNNASPVIHVSGKGKGKNNASPARVVQLAHPGFAVGSAASAMPHAALPTPSAAQVVTLGTTPCLRAQGFQAQRQLNGIYVLNSTTYVGAHPTYWNHECTIFVYYHAAAFRWTLTPRTDPDGIHIHIHIHTYTYTYIYTHTYIHTYIRTYTPIIHTYMHTYTHAYIHVYIYIYV